MTVPLLKQKIWTSLWTGDTQISAVKGASFSINSGETVALVGESGSGKSVSALSILQLLPYPIASHSGRSITFLKACNWLQATQRRLLGVRGNRISMIFQEPMTSLNPLHVIEKQIPETLALHSGLTGREARNKCIELLEMVGLQKPETRLQAYPHQLSGGQRQRVMIAPLCNNQIFS